MGPSGAPLRALLGNLRTIQKPQKFIGSEKNKYSKTNDLPLVFGRCWPLGALLQASWSLWGASWCLLGASWKPLVDSGDGLGAILDRLGNLLGRLEAIVGGIGALPGVKPRRKGPKSGPGPRGANWVTQGVAPFVIVCRGGPGGPTLRHYIYTRTARHGTQAHHGTAPLSHSRTQAWHGTDFRI